MKLTVTPKTVCSDVRAATEMIVRLTFVRESNSLHLQRYAQYAEMQLVLVGFEIGTLADTRPTRQSTMHDAAVSRAGPAMLQRCVTELRRLRRHTMKTQAALRAMRIGEGCKDLARKQLHRGLQTCPNLIGGRPKASRAKSTGFQDCHVSQKALNRNGILSNFLNLYPFALIKIVIFQQAMHTLTQRHRKERVSPAAHPEFTLAS